MYMEEFARMNQDHALELVDNIKAELTDIDMNIAEAKAEKDWFTKELTAAQAVIDGLGGSVEALVHENKICERMDWENTQNFPGGADQCARALMEMEEAKYENFFYDPTTKDCIPCFDIEKLMEIPAEAGVNIYGLNSEVVEAEAKKAHAQEIIDGAQTFLDNIMARRAEVEAEITTQMEAYDAAESALTEQKLARSQKVANDKLKAFYDLEARFNEARDAMVALEAFEIAGTITEDQIT